MLCHNHRTPRRKDNPKERSANLARKTTTSTEVKNRWNAKTYKRYTVNLRQDEDAELIEYVEANKDRINVTDFFRAGVEKIKNEG
jgi:hypothetical protein